METSTFVTYEAFSPRPAQHEIKDIDALSFDLKRLLVKHENILKEEGIRDEVETLERWMESYRQGLKAADKISRRGMDWLVGLRDHLKLAVDEMHRLEGEGGHPATKEQNEKMEDLLKAVTRIESVIPDFEQIFSHSEEPIKSVEPA